MKISTFLSVFMYLPSVFAAETKALSVTIVENGNTHQLVSAFISPDSSKAFMDFGHQNGITFLLDLDAKQSHRLDHNNESVSAVEALPSGTQAVKFSMLTMSPTGERETIAGHEAERFTLKVGVIACGSVYMSRAKALTGLAPLFVQYGQLKAIKNSASKEICRYAEELAFVSAAEHGIPLKYVSNDKTVYEVLRAGDDMPADSRMFSLPSSYKAVDSVENIASVFPHRKPGEARMKTVALADEVQSAPRIPSKKSSKVKSERQHTAAKPALTALPYDKLSIHPIEALSERLDQGSDELFAVLTFASWCPPCVKGLTAVTELNERYGRMGLILHVVVEQSEKDFVKYLKDSKMGERINSGKPYVDFYIDSDAEWSKSYGPKREHALPELIFPNASQELKVVRGFRDSKSYEKRIKAVIREMVANGK